jgi:hypothetical protein
MEDLFPKQEGLDFTKLKMTEEGSYSITRRRDAERIFYMLTQTIPDLNSLKVTDATACIGGDTINFALRCKHVDSIELKQDNFEALSNNVSQYGLSNVTLHQGDSTKLFNWYTDILYIDPPWGGKTYKDHTELDLYISNKRIDTWLEEILLKRNRPTYIILKLPTNYNFKRFNFLSNVDYIRPYRIRTYIMVIITVHRRVSK